MVGSLSNGKISRRPGAVASCLGDKAAIVVAGMLSKRSRRITTSRKIAGVRGRVFQIVPDNVEARLQSAPLTVRMFHIRPFPRRCRRNACRKLGVREWERGLLPIYEASGGNPDLPGSRIETV